jgi:hypothetical protein
MIPVIVFWVALGTGVHSNSSGGITNVFTVIGFVLYGLELVVAIGLLFVQPYRSIGTGLLTMVFVGPVVWSIGCIAILSLPH